MWPISEAERQSVGVEEEVVEMEVEAEGGLQSLSLWESVAKLWVEQDERKKMGQGTT